MLCTVHKYITGFAQYALPTNKPSEVFQPFTTSVEVAFGVIHPSRSAKVVINVETVVPDLLNADVMVTDELA